MIRSFLFVPGDSERKQTKALGSAADALIFDLEDSVAASKLPDARNMVAAALRSRPRPDAGKRSGPAFWVRVNSLGTGKLIEDLVAVIGGAPQGVVLPKVASAAEVVEISNYLSALEQREGVDVGTTQVLVIATETPQALLGLGGYVAAFEGATGAQQALRSEQAKLASGGGSGTSGAQVLRHAGEPTQAPSATAVAARRLLGLTWGMEDLGAALGSSSKVDEQGALTFTFQLARSTCLLAAAALNVQAIDGVQADFRDSEGLKRESAAARRDGFTGKMAIHPDQVPIINSAFTPTTGEVEHAQRVVAAFAAAPDAGVTSLDGAMLDRPHLVQAQRILAAAERNGDEQ